MDFLGLTLESRHTVICDLINQKIDVVDCEKPGRPVPPTLNIGSVEPGDLHNIVWGCSDRSLIKTVGVVV